MKQCLIFLSLTLLISGTWSLLDSGECGRDKTCFIEEDFSRQFSYNQPGAGDVLTIEMQAKNSRWVATSFSSDLFMGDDDVISCECAYFQDTPDNCTRIIAKDLSLNGRSNFVANHVDTSQNLCVLEAEYTADGEIYCKVERLISGADPADADLSDCLYQFYSAGQSNLRLDRHVIYEPFAAPLRSSSCIEVQLPISSNIRTVQVSNCQYWKPHLGLNILAWMLLFPIACFIWHFLVPTLGDDRRIWFITHRLILFASSLLAIIAFVLFLVYSGLTVPPQYRVIGLWILDFDIFLSYQIIGIFVLILAIIIPFVSFAKCSKFNHPTPRFIFDLIYFYLLLFTIIVSNGYIMLGLFITESMNCYYNTIFDDFYPPSRISRYLMGAWIFCTATIFFLFDIYHVTDERIEKDKQIYQMAAMQDNKLLPDGSLASSAYPRSEGFYTPTDMPLRDSVFTVFVVICVIFSVSVVILVGLS
ncbi:Ferric-chelate reductase 1-like [Oopsacas minuta]|uniref:Ferric-chelate reductase 1-like n=1 Tax=Oopsacas minuta TaxID=111878 RepID=A0AAV7JF35_9METZ|nr:Ferric-chelate reductase 1-like [Oopsacas minuta]